MREQVKKIKKIRAETPYGTIDQYVRVGKRNRSIWWWLFLVYGGGV